MRGTVKIIIICLICMSYEIVFAYKISAPIKQVCPENYILIPALLPYVNNDFCVAKFEMKNDGMGIPVSHAKDEPWTNISRPTAQSKCKMLGASYDLISNDQWQAIARNIAGVANNWSSGTVAIGALNNGNSYLRPRHALEASEDDNNSCFGMSNCFVDNRRWTAVRRTHTLSNGSVIWDFSGNVAEWTRDTPSLDGGGWPNDYISDKSTMKVGHFKQASFGAASDTICKGTDAWPHCGMGYGSINYSSSIIRGGSWANAEEGQDDISGIFAADLHNDPSIGYRAVGFRCVVNIDK